MHLKTANRCILIEKNKNTNRKNGKVQKCKITLSSKSIFKSFWKGYKTFLVQIIWYRFNSKDRLIVVIGISTFLF
jgi:hypothetical protein